VQRCGPAANRFLPVIAAIALANLIGTWHCVSNDPPVNAVYTLRANHTGALVWLFPRSVPTARRFTFTLNGHELVERFTDGHGSLPALHTIELTRNRLVDETHIYLRDGRWTPIPMATVLNCKR
jgi:hypothetical protein